MLVDGAPNERQEIGGASVQTMLENRARPLEARASEPKHWHAPQQACPEPRLGERKLLNAPADHDAGVMASPEITWEPGNRRSTSGEAFIFDDRLPLPRITHG